MPKNYIEKIANFEDFFNKKNFHEKQTLFEHLKKFPKFQSIFQKKKNNNEMQLQIVFLNLSKLSYLKNVIFCIINKHRPRDKLRRYDKSSKFINSYFYVIISGFIYALGPSF